MPQDLSKIKELRAVESCFEANEVLGTKNWVLLRIEVTEDIHWQSDSRVEHGGYIRKRSDVTYILGRIE